jgi:hypothetical protein
VIIDPIHTIVEVLCNKSNFSVDVTLNQKKAENAATFAGTFFFVKYIYIHCRLQVVYTSKT